MPETVVTRTTSNQQVGGTNVQQEAVNSEVHVDGQEFTIAKANQVLWFIGHIIAVLLALRFIFLILGANMRGIVLFIYELSGVFILPFSGIFPSARTGEFFFDSAALLGILMYYLLILLITNALLLLSKRTNV